MNPAQENQILLEHKFLGKVRSWLDDHYPDGSPSGFLYDDCAGMAVNELFEHWISVMGEFSDEKVRDSFLRDLDEVIDTLLRTRKSLS